MLTRALVCLSLFAALGCGGEPTGSSMPTGADLCAVNPLASSCGSVAAEVKQSAVFGPPNFTSDWLARWGSYTCAATGNTFIMGGRTHTYQDSFSGLWKTRYEVVNPPFGATTTLSVAPLIQLTQGMDGPYHVAYNVGPGSYTENVCIASFGHPQCTLAQIPAYGTWIYAKNERPDYPDGVQIITIDPQQPDPFLGACNQRVQFIVPI